MTASGIFADCSSVRSSSLFTEAVLSAMTGSVRPPRPMLARFTVLASGSSGNASVLDVGGFGVLLDFGIGPRTLQKHLDHVGYSWTRIRAACLTHLHSDHWNHRVLAKLTKHRIPLWC